jgi:hypothetical protein
VAIEKDNLRKTGNPLHDIGSPLRDDDLESSHFGDLRTPLLWSATKIASPKGDGSQSLALATLKGAAQ